MPEPPPCPVHSKPISAGMRKYMGFDAGCYWIFEDSASGIIDSLYLAHAESKYQDFPSSAGSGCPDHKFRFLYYIELHEIRPGQPSRPKLPNWMRVLLAEENVAYYEMHPNCYPELCGNAIFVDTVEPVPPGIKWQRFDSIQVNGQYYKDVLKMGKEPVTYFNAEDGFLRFENLPGPNGPGTSVLLRRRVQK